MCEMIAELCSSHNGSRKRAIDLVEAALHAGFDTVKIPLRGPRWADGREHPLWLEPDDVDEAAGRAIDLCLDVVISVHRGGDEFLLRQLQYEAYRRKIASYEIRCLDLITLVSAPDRDTLLSCGLASDAEIGAAVSAVYDAGGTPRTLACVSEYPATPEAARRVLDDRLWYGYSDHTHDVETILYAVRERRVNLVEVHLDLDDRAGAETSRGHVWTESEAKAMLRAVHGLTPEHLWRADPADDMRPLRCAR